MIKTVLFIMTFYFTITSHLICAKEVGRRIGKLLRLKCYGKSGSFVSVLKLIDKLLVKLNLTTLQLASRKRILQP